MSLRAGCRLISLAELAERELKSNCNFTQKQRLNRLWSCWAQYSLSYICKYLLMYQYLYNCCRKNYSLVCSFCKYVAFHAKLNPFMERMHMAAILVFQNTETVAMLVYQTNPVGVQLFSYINTFFSSNKFAWLLDLL